MWESIPKFAADKQIKTKNMSKKNSITTADYLPYEEFQRLLDCLEKDGKYKQCAYCLLSFCLALRISDTLTIRWMDILNKPDIIVTEMKTEKTRQIPISQNISNRLYDLYMLAGCPPLSEYVLYSGYTGRAMTKQYVNKLCKAWKKKYGLKIGNFSSHTFRKTFGRYVYEKMGRTDEALIKLNYIFHHTSLKITQIYIGLRKQETDEIFNSLG